MATRETFPQFPLLLTDRLWFHSVIIQTGDLLSFLQNLTDTDVIVVSSGYQTETIERWALL